MIQQRSWADVVSQIQHSGLQLLKQKQRKTLQRNMFLQKDLLQQINQTKKMKNQMHQQKQISRMEALEKDRKSEEKQLKVKQKIRQKQQRLRQQNFQLLNQKKQLLNLHNQKQKSSNFFQNPITAKLVNNSQERRQKSKENSKQINIINKNLLTQKQGQHIKEKQKDNKEGQKYQNYVQEGFRKMEQQRQKFKKQCLEGKNSKLGQRSQIMASEPDSLQKQYSAYLQQQISEKMRQASRNRHYKSEMNDKIDDINILKINHDLEKQSPSPAYIGRLPHNHDREKQLSYIDNQIFRHRRFKTQDQINQQKVANVQSYRSQYKKNTTDVVQPNFHSQYSPYMKKQYQEKPKIMRQFKQYNVLTGTTTIRNHYTTQFQ